MHAGNSFYPIDSLVEPIAAGRIVLTPNHRLARRIKLAWGQYMAGQGSQAWPTPQVMSLDHWWQHCYRTRVMAGDELPGLIGPAQEQALWLQCVESSDSAAALLRPTTAAELARDAYSNLLLWNLDWRSEGVAQQFRFGEDTRLFLEWATEFERRLQSLGMSTLAALVPDLAAACPVESIVMAEFGDISPRIRAALETQATELQHHRAGKENAAGVLRPCDSHGGELEAAARWAAEQHREAPGRRLGILLPGLQQERRDMERALHRAFGSDPRKPETLPVNFSAGIPLSECGPVEAALGLLALPARDSSLAELGRVLQTRYRDSGEREGELDAWHYLLLDAREPVPPAEVRHQLGRVSNRLGKQLTLQKLLLEAGDARQLRSRRLPSEWRGLFRKLLEDFAWPGPGPLDSLEYQQVELFYKVLEDLGTLDPIEGDITYTAALSSLEQLCAHTVFQAQTPDAPIQVLGLLEAAGLQFDALWVCNMGANEWPQAARPSPFIPVSLQRTHKLPHADANRELEYARQLMAHLRQSCSEILASYTRLDEEVAVAPSPLLDGFKSGAVVEDLPWPAHWTYDSEALAGEADVDAPAVTAEEAANITGGSAIIGNQAQCPFRAFAYHRLIAQPLPDAQIALTAAERGAILHDGLNHLWGELGSSDKLAAATEDMRKTLANESAQIAVDGFRGRGGRRHGEGLLALEQKRLEGLLLDWLAVESERSAFVVAAREQRHELELGPLTITLRIDRVDELPGGEKLVIDYKSGDSKVRLWLGDRPEDPQLPLYTQLLAPGEVAGVSFAVLRHSAVEYRGLAASSQGPGISTDIAKATSKLETSLDDWAALQAHWKAVLQELAQEFLDGHAAVAPIDRKNSCTFCGLEALCRVR